RGHVRGAGPGRRLGPAARGDQDRVVLEPLAAVRVDDLVAQVDLSRPRLEMNLDALLRGLLGRAHEDLFPAHLAAQVARQGDAVVERMLLGGDDRDRRLAVGLAQIFSARLTSDAVAENDEALCHAPLPLAGERWWVRAVKEDRKSVV